MHVSSSSYDIEFEQQGSLFHSCMYPPPHMTPPSHMTSSLSNKDRFFILIVCAIVFVALPSSISIAYV